MRVMCVVEVDTHVIHNAICNIKLQEYCIVNCYCVCMQLNMIMVFVCVFFLNGRPVHKRCTSLYSSVPARQSLV